MVNVNTQIDQDKIADFIPDEKYLFAVGNAAYDSVHYIKHFSNEVRCA